MKLVPQEFLDNLCSSKRISETHLLKNVYILPIYGLFLLEEIQGSCLKFRVSTRHELYATY